MNVLELLEKCENEKNINYPILSSNLCRKLKSSYFDNYETYIFREEKDYQVYNFYISFCLPNNATRRIFFVPEYGCFSLFVYPNIKEATGDYHFSISDIPQEFLSNKYLSILSHLGEKSWMTVDIYDDLIKLMIKIKEDKQKLIDITNCFNKNELSDIWESLL